MNTRRISPFFFVIALTLLSCVLPAARGEDGITYEFAFAAHSISTDEYIRHVGPDLSADTLGRDEYYRLYLTIHNDTGRDISIGTAEMRVDDLRLTWKDITCRRAFSFTVSRDTMKAIGPGKHTCSPKLDGKNVFTHEFTLSRDWNSVMPFPTDDQLSARKGGLRSPYITFRPQFPNRSRFTEYSLDFRADHGPTGTYICPMNWWMDMSALEKKVKRVWCDFGGVVSGYAGLQVWNDGTHGVIMTVWDTFYEDKSGNIKQIKATVTYPDNASDTRHDNSSEGSFVHYSYPFPWKTGRDYRLLLQMYDGEKGTKCLDLWIMDLETEKWTLLFSIDTNISEDMTIYDCAGFLECFDTRTAGSVRTMEVWNARALIRGRGWVNIDRVKFGVNESVLDLGYEGSHIFGADRRSAYMITSGVPGLGASKGDTFRMPSDESGQPY